jgi:hypothetical protein
MKSRTVLKSAGHSMTLRNQKVVEISVASVAARVHPVTSGGTSLAARDGAAPGNAPKKNV